jgi:hypothetical protein
MVAWQARVPGISPLNILYHKLHHTVVALKAWSKKALGSARLELYMVKEIIKQLDIAQENRHLSSEELQLKKYLKNRVLGLAAIERSRC